MGGGQILIDKWFSTFRCLLLELFNNNKPPIFASNYKKQFAFTLAEVLITIAIIGVVAVMALPTLYKNYQKKYFEEKLIKTYSEFTSAIKLSELTNESYAYWDYKQNSQNFTNQYLFPYMKTRQKSAYNVYKTNKYKYLNGSYVPDSWSVSSDRNTVTFITNNGALIFVDNWIDPNNNIKYILIDLNGDAKPNVYGKDLYGFVINSENGFVPTNYKKSVTLDKCKKTGVACSEILRLNNWKFPKDYPW